uniref:Transposase Tc1-like domain-containing protein n=1 Tax=Scleropages formosus TaxID=113540 RepID=A0A8C9ST39_SCLFO
TVSVRDSTIRKRLGKNGIHGRNTKAHFWANILWTDETKVELFGRCGANTFSRHGICKYIEVHRV